MNTNNTINLGGAVPSRGNTERSFGYDLKSEKEEMIEIARRVKSELLANWKKSYANAQIFPAQIAAMHPDVVDFLLSFNLVSVYDNIARQVGLDEKGRNALPQVVWKMAQSKNWNDIDNLLESQIPLVHSAHVTVAQLLQQNIINNIRALSEKTLPTGRQAVLSKTVSEQQPQKKEEQITLSKALEQYPKVGEQNVTASQLKLRVFPTPVRPSIRNWISDYHDAMGSGKHSPIDRGNYLFHSENGKKLTAGERQKLSMILKSLDEESQLIVDTQAQAIVFKMAEQSVDVPALSTNEPLRETINQKPTELPKARMFGEPDYSFTGKKTVTSPSFNEAKLVSSSQPSRPFDQKDVFERFAPRPAQSTQQPPVRKSFSPDFKSMNVQSAPTVVSAGPTLNGTPLKTSFSSEVPVKETVEVGKKIGQGIERQQIVSGGTFQSTFANAPREEKIVPFVSPQPSVAKPTISFSSPQKLPSEQKSQIVQAPVKKQTQTIQAIRKSEMQTQMISKPAQSPVASTPINAAPAAPVRPTAKVNPYHIAPSRYVPEEKPEEKKQTEPKVKGNTVDLRG